MTVTADMSIRPILAEKLKIEQETGIREIADIRILFWKFLEDDDSAILFKWVPIDCVDV
jgi:hypothetical protein